jgi:NitT/TauT family transport system permease protein
MSAAPRIRALSPVCGLGALVAAWAVAVWLARSPIIPGPWAVARGIVELARRGLLVRYTVASLYRVTWGYLLAVLLAVPTGLWLGWSRRAALTLNPFLQILRPISPLAWIPLAILWLGVGDLSAIAIIFVASYLPLVVTTMNAVRGVAQVHVQAGRNFGFSTARLLWSVLLPAVLPRLIVGLRLALGIAWLVVVAAEMIAVNSGLGFLIIDSRNAGNRYDLVMAGMVLIGVTGYLLDAMMRRLERLAPLRWAAEGR